MNACIEEICSKSTQETQCCLQPTDRCIQCSRRLVCWSQLSHSYYQAGLADWMTNLRTGVDATMRHSHISGGRAFSHSHDVCGLTASGSVSAECGEFLETLLVGARPAMVVGDGCRTLWEVVVKGREQHNRTWLIVHWAVDSVGCHRRG